MKILVLTITYVKVVFFLIPNYHWIYKQKITEKIESHHSIAMKLRFLSCGDSREFENGSNFAFRQFYLFLLILSKKLKILYTQKWYNTRHRNHFQQFDKVSRFTVWTTPDYCQITYSFQLIFKYRNSVIPTTKLSLLWNFDSNWYRQHWLHFIWIVSHYKVVL